nr:Tn3 family transposase [Micromonospora ureilytica]
MRREIHEGLQVVEQWNSANVALHYGREAELPGADREAQEISTLSLHLLQSALVLINTRMVDRVLAEPEWAARLIEHDLRGLTPLFWSNVAPHGTFQLDLDQRIDYGEAPPVPSPPGPRRPETPPIPPPKEGTGGERSVLRGAGAVETLFNAPSARVERSPGRLYVGVGPAGARRRGSRSGR